MKLFEIPSLDIIDAGSFHSKMFPVNNTFQVSSRQGKIFELRDLKPIENNSISSVKHVYSFANNTIVWRSKDVIEQLESDFSLKKICDCTEMKQFSFCGGGIAVFNNDPFTKALVVDLKAFITT